MRSWFLPLTLLVCHATAGCNVLDLVSRKSSDDDGASAAKPKQRPKPKPKAPPEVEWQKYGARLNFKKKLDG